MSLERNCLAAADDRSCLFSFSSLASTFYCSRLDTDSIELARAWAAEGMWSCKLWRSSLPNWRSMQCSAGLFSRPLGKKALPLPLSALSTLHLFVPLFLSKSHLGWSWPAGVWLPLSLERERVGRRAIKLTPSSLIFSLGSNLPYLLYTVSRQDRCKFACFKAVLPIDCSQMKSHWQPSSRATTQSNARKKRILHRHLDCLCTTCRNNLKMPLVINIWSSPHILLVAAMHYISYALG